MSVTPQQMLERSFQFRELKAEIDLFQFRRLHSKAAEERFFGHLAHEKFQGKLRHHEQRRTAQRGCQCFGQVDVANGLGAHHVDRSAERLVC